MRIKMIDRRDPPFYTHTIQINALYVSKKYTLKPPQCHSMRWCFNNKMRYIVDLNNFLSRKDGICLYLSLIKNGGIIFDDDI
jgi:hypothetical protein